MPGQFENREWTRIDANDGNPAASSIDSPIPSDKLSPPDVYQDLEY